MFLRGSPYTQTLVGGEIMVFEEEEEWEEEDWEEEEWEEEEW
ncbi:MAG: hypothetical protein RMJ03_00465 [Nitrososphaerota archaeon]|nr:hypothetical protein [Nitrososphaerota archaeon]